MSQRGPANRTLCRLPPISPVELGRLTHAPPKIYSTLPPFAIVAASFSQSQLLLSFLFCRPNNKTKIALFVHPSSLVVLHSPIHSVATRGGRTCVISVRAAMASHRALLLLLLSAALVAALAAVASADDAKPSILTPVAQTPLGSFDGDKPASDDDEVEDDDDAAPVGAPNGATMTEPKDVPAPPGAEATAGGAAASNAPATLAAAAALVCAAVAVAAGAFASF